MRLGSGRQLGTGLAALVLIAACTKSKPTEPRVATNLAVVAGSGQSGKAGTPLAVKVKVVASDAQGPLSGVSVHAEPQNAQSGRVSPANSTTDANGASEFTWTLGGLIGPQGLIFTTGSIAPASATASAAAGDPVSVVAISDIFQFSVVSRNVSSTPSVRVTDAFGNPIAGVAVTFEATSDGSTLTGTAQTSTAAGVATVSSWAIGPDAIFYTARATIPGGAAAVFEARGIPATVSVFAGNGQTANAGTALPTAPAVRALRDDSSPLQGVTVNFAVTSGAGIIQGETATTDNTGVAHPTRWILGTAPGTNLAQAQVSGRDPVTFSATGVPAAPADIVAQPGGTQTAFFGNFVSAAPAVIVRDLAGNPVAGQTVTYAVTQGDGQLTGAQAVSDFLGRAPLSAWRLGSAVSHTVTATAGGLSPVAFTATALPVPASSFSLEVRFTTPPTASQQAAFDFAVARWKQVLISGGAPYPIAEPAFGPCPAMNETVPGLVIFATLGPIDGPGNVLGRAGPCIVRDDPTYQPAMGIMQFDTADLAGEEANGRLNDIIIHEMGHVLGFGTMWNFDPFPGVTVPNAFLTGAGTGDPFFNGGATQGPFLAAVAAGRTFTGTPVPVENTGGSGTRDSHWREISVTTELMTGFVSAPGTLNPLSAFSAASFRDLGYVVNDAAADPFSFLASLLAGPTSGGMELREAAILAPIVVKNRLGRTVARIPRR